MKRARGGTARPSKRASKKSTAIAKRVTSLAKIQDLAAALAVCRNVDELREIRDRAKALETYMRARGVGVEGLADAAEVTLRAERRLGELCSEVAVPARPKKASPRVTLSELGITRKQSSLWQKLAGIPALTFEEKIAEARQRQARITVAGLLASMKPRVAGDAGDDDDVLDIETDETWLDEELDEHGWTITAAQRAAVVARAQTHGAQAALDLLRALAWSQWDTDPELARKMVELAALGFEGRRDRVLEPSAGTGSIVRAIRAAAPKASVTAHEIDPLRVERLRALAAEGLCDHVVAGDFFERAHYEAPEGSRPFDCSIQNTAYENGLDGLFLERVMQLCDRVVALLRTNAMHGADRYKRVWSKCTKGGAWGLRDLIYLPSRPEFDSIIADGSARSDFVVVRLDRGFSGETRVDWWV